MSPRRFLTVSSAVPGTIVAGCGPVASRLMIVGERPGENEAIAGKPFVGRAGQEQNRYLGNEGMHDSQFYKTNVVKDYAEGNADPTPADIARWTPTLLDEIARVQPRAILAVGRFAVRWFLGEDTDMEMVHGMPHRAGAFDSTRVGRAPADCVIMPCFHPAFGFYDDEARTLIAYDYARAVAIIKGRASADIAEDDYAGLEDYRDVGGEELADEIADRRRVGSIAAFGIDTEGYPDDPWSVQVALAMGHGRTLRWERSDFALGARAIQSLADDPNTVAAIHNAMYDLEMSRAMGMDFFSARLFDSMYAAYLTRIEPQGLKPLAYRWCGMRMQSYNDTVGDAALERQIEYLSHILERGPWPKPEPRIEYSNDGTTRLYTPQPVERRAEAILIDHYNGKVDKDGGPIVAKRWKQVDLQLRRMVEQALGPMPRGSLSDIPLPAAIRYASRDPDATLRLYWRLVPALRAQGLTDLMANGMTVLPVFEEMQANGMPARRAHFAQLSDRMWTRMCEIQSRISHRYCGGRPFNPASSDQTAALMRRRGLVGEKRSKKTGKMSTGKKSIEHLRYSDEAIADVIEWREHQKIRDAFCTPILERIPEEHDIYPVRCTIKTTRVATRRISASDPNLTAIPVRNELGRDVRDGYETPEDELFGSWDLSQIEMRYMAHLSRDPLLVKFFNDPRLDVHCETAARIFGLRVYSDAPTKAEMYAEIQEMEHRYPAKRAGFGIITNIQGGGLLDQLRMFGCKGWDVESCDRLIKEWLRVYKGVADFLEACKVEVRAKGMVRDYWGMPRYLPGVWSDDPRVAAEAERAASSHKIQGGAQGMIQKSMGWLKDYVRAMQQAGENVHWCLQIHDEVILRFAKALWEVLNPLVIEGLTAHTLPLIVPVKASGACARTWGKLKG